METNSTATCGTLIQDGFGNSSSNALVTTTVASGSTSLGGGSVTWTPNYSISYWPCYPATVYMGKVKLTMSEIDALRKVAKSDKKVKAALAKLGDLIEIEVDFE